MRNLCDLVDTNEFIVYCHRINFLVNIVNKNCVCRSHKRVNPHLAIWRLELGITVTMH